MPTDNNPSNNGTFYCTYTPKFTQAASGSATATLGTLNSPVTVTTPYRWIDIIAPDGTPCVFPIWKR